MEPVNITFGRALKIWWSFAWRAWMLMLLLMVPMEFAFVFYMRNHFPKPGDNPAEAMRMVGAMMIFWPIFVAAMIAVQAQAMRWVLKKVRWSDFRLALLPRDQ